MPFSSQTFGESPRRQGGGAGGGRASGWAADPAG
jgi:hypothetical protein